MSEMSAIHGVVFCDRKIIFLEERSYYSATIVNDSGKLVRMSTPVPTLKLTPESAEEARRKCLADTLVYETLLRAGTPCPEYPNP